MAPIDILMFPVIASWAVFPWVNFDDASCILPIADNGLPAVDPPPLFPPVGELDPVEEDEHDAADEHDLLLRICKKYSIRHVLETHGHFDHIQAVPQLRDAGLSIFINKADT